MIRKWFFMNFNVKIAFFDEKKNMGLIRVAIESDPTRMEVEEDPILATWIEYPYLG